MRDKQALIDIISAIQHIFIYAHSVDQEDLRHNDEKLAAILYRLIIIGEATKRLTSHLRDQHPSIPWRQMAGLRDVVIHDYDQLDFDILWNVIHGDLPIIMPQIRFILDEL